MAALSTQQVWAAVDPVVRSSYGLSYKKGKPEFKQIFEVSKGKEPVRSSVEFGGPGQLSLKSENGPVSSLTIRQGTPKTWNYVLYAGEVTLSWELAKDCKIREIKTVTSSLGRATRLTPEYLAAQFLDRAFNSAFPATADSKELCATDHLVIGTNTSNGSNELATPAALSETSLEDVLTNLMTMKGADGMIVPVMAKQLIVPAALSHTAEKLSRTKTQVGTANNTVSVVSGMKATTFRYLDSATRWFVQTDHDNGLWWEWDEEAQFMEDNSPTTLQKVYVAFFRARWGCDDWRGIYGVAAA